MTYSEINMAVAKACGWTWDDDRVYNPSGGYWSRWMTVSKLAGQDTLLDRIPSYCNDLNAMHKAERTIPDVEWGQYKFTLELVTGAKRRDEMGFIVESTRKTVSATAYQRAEAFLRTLGKWREA